MVQFCTILEKNAASKKRSLHALVKSFCQKKFLHQHAKTKKMCNQNLKHQMLSLMELNQMGHLLLSSAEYFFSMAARYPDWVDEMMGEALWWEIWFIVNKPKRNVELKSVIGEVHCKREKCCASEPFTLGPTHSGKIPGALWALINKNIGCNWSLNPNIVLDPSDN